MQPSVRGQALRDLSVTVQALEYRVAASELMATGALRGAVEGLVSLREGTGRDLSTGETGGQQ